MTKYIWSFTNQCLKFFIQHEPEQFCQGKVLAFYICTSVIPSAIRISPDWRNAGFMKAEWHSLYTVGIIPLCISVNFNFFGVVDLSQFSNGNTDPRIVNLNYNTSILGFYSPIFEDVSEAFNKSPGVCGVTVWKPLHRRLLIEEIIASLRCDRYRSLSLFCRAQSNLSFGSLLFVAAITLEEQDSWSITKQA